MQASFKLEAKSQLTGLKWTHSYAWSFASDHQRLKQLRSRVNVMPLGSGALAGNPFLIDRSYLADQLRFDGVTPNSLLAVADRDFVSMSLATISRQITSPLCSISRVPIVGFPRKSAPESDGRRFVTYFSFKLNRSVVNLHFLESFIQQKNLTL